MLIIRSGEISREDDYRDMTVFRRSFQLPAKIAAIGVRQAEIQQDQVRHKIPHRAGQLTAQRNIQHFKALIGKRLGNHFQNGLVVVYY